MDVPTNRENIVHVTQVTTAQTLEANKSYVLPEDAGVAIIELQLPASPEVGDKISIRSARENGYSVVHPDEVGGVADQFIAYGAAANHTTTNTGRLSSPLASQRNGFELVYVGATDRPVTGKLWLVTKMWPNFTFA